MEQETLNEENIKKEIEELRKDIRNLTATIKRLGEDRAESSRPTGPRGEILELLEEYGKPLSIKEISQKVGLAEATVSGYALDLYTGGFLDRDRRLVQVSPKRRVRQLEYYIPGKKKKKWHYVD